MDVKESLVEKVSELIRDDKLLQALKVMHDHINPRLGFVFFMKQLGVENDRGGLLFHTNLSVLRQRDIWKEYQDRIDDGTISPETFKNVVE